MNYKYFLFAGSTFYPNGGFEDFKGSFSSVSDVERWLIGKRDKGEFFDWYHVVDITTEQIEIDENSNLEDFRDD